MSAYGLLCDLRRRGVEVRVTDGRLTVTPAASLTIRDSDDLQKHEREILRFLPFTLTAPELKELERKWVEAERRYWTAPECSRCHLRHSAAVSCEGESLVELERVARQRDCAHTEVTRSGAGGFVCDLCGLYLFRLPQPEKPERYAIHDPAEPTTMPSAATWRCTHCGLPNSNSDRSCYHCATNRTWDGAEADGGAVESQSAAPEQRPRRAS